MFDTVLASWYLPSIVRSVQSLPKEIAYAAAAGLTLNELHKRHTQMKLKETEINAQVRLVELEVEKLHMQLELHNARAENPLT